MRKKLNPRKYFSNKIYLSKFRDTNKKQFLKKKKIRGTKFFVYIYLFESEFQLMAFALDNNFLSLN